MTGEPNDYDCTVTEFADLVQSIDEQELQRLVEQDSRKGIRDAAQHELDRRADEPAAKPIDQDEEVTDFKLEDIEDEDSEEEHTEQPPVPLTDGAMQDPDVNDQASRTLQAAKAPIDPSVRRRGAALPGGAEYKSQTAVNARSAHEGYTKFIVRYERHTIPGKPKAKTDRARTRSDYDGMFDSRAEAKEVAARIEKQRVRLKDGRRTNIPKFTNVRVVEQELPARILTWDKWSELRVETRKHCLAAGLALTGGDRTPERNELVGGVRNSSHLTTRKDRWADDYVSGSYAVLHRVAGELQKKFGHRGRLEILVHDAGSGTHLHVGGPTGNN